MIGNILLKEKKTSLSKNIYRNDQIVNRWVSLIVDN